jgi:predicted nucleic acid-binding protein
MARAGHAADYPDLWIAACAVAKNIPILTRNPKHFANVPELQVIGYEIV